MKQVKQICALFLAIGMCISGASANQPIIVPRAWSQIAVTTYSFDLNDNGQITVFGSTTGCDDSTEVTVEVYVERQKTGGWSTVPGMSWSESTTSSNHVSISKIRWVDSGYSYRLRVEHSATGPRGTETETSYSGTYSYE